MKITNTFSFLRLLATALLLLIVWGCEQSSDSSNTAIIKIQLPAEFQPANNNAISPSSITGKPGDINRIIITVQEASTGKELVSGDIYAAGGSLAYEVPAFTGLTVSGFAYANQTLKFRGSAPVPALQPGSQSNVSLTLNSVDGTEVGGVITIGISPSPITATVFLYEVENDGTPVGNGTPIASAAVENGEFVLQVPSAILPGSHFVVRTTIGSDTLESRYIDQNVIELNPVTHAASKLVTELASIPGKALSDISTQEIKEIQRTLQNIQNLTAPYDPGGEGTLNNYADNLIQTLKSNIQTSAVATSAITGNSICGSVTDSSDNPQSGIQVMVRDFETFLLAARTTTDNNGQYCVNVQGPNEEDPFTQFQTRNYIIGAINKSGTNTVASGWWTPSGAAALRLDAGKLEFIETEQLTANFNLQSGARIQGTVTGQDGSTLPGIKILVRDKATQFLAAAATTGADGNYRVNVLPGEYIIEARNTTSDQPFASGTYVDAATNTNIRNEGTIVPLATNDVFPANFVLGNGSLLSGTITENAVPVTGVRVVVNNTGSASTRLRVSNVDGSYQVWMTPDIYNVRAYGQRDYGIDISTAGQTYASAFSAPVAKQPVVVRHNGQGISKAKLRIYHVLGGEVFTLRHDTFSKSDGSAILYSDNTNGHVITARIEGEEQYGSIIFDGETQLNAGNSISMFPGQTNVSEIVNLPDAGVLTGIVFSDVTPIVPLSNLTVTVFLQGASSGWDELVTTRTRGDGTYTLSLPEGIYERISVVNVGSCTNIPIVTGETTELNIGASDGTICDTNIAPLNIGGIEFNRRNSFNFNSHTLRLQVLNNNVWNFTGTNPRYYSFARTIANGVPSILASEYDSNLFVESHALALATDGNIYALQTTDGSGTTTIWSEPKLFLPGDLTTGATWLTPDGSGINEIVETGVTSPSGYSNTIHITTTNINDNTQVWHRYIRQTDGIVEEIDEIIDIASAAYTRTDINSPPVITLIGPATVDVVFGTVYTDDGATASDLQDGDLTASIVIDNPVNTDVLGTYTVTYDVTDNGGASAIQVTRTVNVVSGSIIPVSVDSQGNLGNNDSARFGQAFISTDGRYVTFKSDASNLVAGDTNGLTDIFVHDSQTGTTTRINVDSNGLEANSGSDNPTISADGRYVAFQSYATNLVAGDTNGLIDVFVHDRQTGVTTRVSVSTSGAEADRDVVNPRISADGRYVTLESYATTLVDGDTNNLLDIFVHDRNTGATSRVSVDSSGNEGIGNSRNPGISGDGRYVVFDSDVGNLVADDNNGRIDIFVHDRNTSTTTRVSVDSVGLEANGASRFPHISADGRYVTFYSHATNLVAEDDTNGALIDVFVHDRQTGITTKASVSSTGVGGDDTSHNESISDDGRYVAFHTSSSNLVAGDSNGLLDIFIHDRQTGLTMLVNVNDLGIQGNGIDWYPMISGDGRYLTFTTQSTNLFTNDGNSSYDVVRVPLNDEDGDGLFDRVELSLGTLPENTDSDGDTFSDTDEVLAGTNPANAASNPNNTAPEITLLGTNPVTVSLGGTYTDAGATAADTEDGDLTNSILTTGLPIDTNTAGTYTITYDVTDSGELPATQVTRTVEVIGGV